LTIFVFLAYLVTSSGSLIFSYDIGISDGVTSMDPFLKGFFPLYAKEQQVVDTNQYCKFNSVPLTQFTSSLYDGIVFLVGAALNGFVVHVAMLIIARILLAIEVGLNNHVVPLYLFEMAPTKMHGMLNITF
jgi:MFS transporter, SP family, sugar:H+ symporter